jgi:hypothetical protein
MDSYLEVWEAAVHELSTIRHIPPQGLLKLTNDANTSEVSVFIVYMQCPAFTVSFGHQHATTVHKSALIALQG